MIQGTFSRRSKSRTRVLMTATVISSEGSQKLLVRDISPHGAQICAKNSLSEGGDVCFERGAIFVAARVAWRTTREAGLKFYRELNASEINAAFHAVIQEHSETDAERKRPRTG